MNINRFFLTCSFLIFFAFTGCVTTDIDPANDTRTISDLIQHIKDSGLKIDKIYRVEYRAVLASGGVVLEIENTPVEFYIYDPAVNYQKKRLDNIKKEHKLDILGIPTKCLVNGKFVMFDYSQKPTMVKIRKVFRSFSVKEKKK